MASSDNKSLPQGSEPAYINTDFRWDDGTEMQVFTPQSPRKMTPPPPLEACPLDEGMACPKCGMLIPVENPKMDVCVVEGCGDCAHMTDEIFCETHWLESK